MHPAEGRVSEEWSEESDPTLTSCDRCDRIAPCIYDSDPFTREVYGTETESSWWCRPCWSERKDEV